MSLMPVAVFEGPGRIAVEHRPLPVPTGDAVRVRIEGCGVCGSNLPVWSGRPWFQYPFAAGAPGHEGWGEIDAVGDAVTRWRVGDRVALLSQHAYSGADIAHADDVVALPASLDGMAVPGEALACAMNIFRRSRIEAGQWVAIVGVGFIGALLVQLASAAGAKVMALSRRPYALEVARSCGATQAFTSEDRYAAAGCVGELTGGRGCPVVIEAAGEQATLDLASDLVGEGGVLVVAGYHQDGPRTVDMQQWNWRGIDVVNAHERDQAVVRRGLQAGIDALVEGRLDLASLLTHELPLGRLDRAFEAMQQRPDGFLKAVVRP